MTSLFPLGHDVIAQAQSGTGKTATFSIAILQQIDITLKECQALVLAPTRELAQQIQKVAKTMLWLRLKVFSMEPTYIQSGLIRTFVLSKIYSIYSHFDLSRHFKTGCDVKSEPILDSTFWEKFR